MTIVKKGEQIELIKQENIFEIDVCAAISHNIFY